MTFQPVEAVFFWRYLKSAYRAAYGRLPPTTLYTKDFLQSSGSQRTALDNVLGLRPGNRIAIEYHWPGGSRPGGEWRESAADNRGQLAWPIANAPAPWRVGNPQIDAGIAIPGDPTKTTEQEAEAEMQALDQRNLDPWIVAVKLRGQSGVLHARAYLGAPLPGLENKSTERLPLIVRNAMTSLSTNNAGGAVVIPETINLRSPKLVRRIIEALKRDPNVLLVGPPGTGKTVALEDLRTLFEGMNPTITFDPDLWDDAWGEFSLPLASARKVVSLVFHPSYSYENFVAGLVPRSGSDGITLVAHPGPLLSLAHWASDQDRSALLIVDEFNRGPAAAIFGDTLALLDKEKRDDPGSARRGVAIERPYPRETMNVGDGYANYSGTEIADEVRLPASLWLVAAFNSTDRSVAPLDAALRRRFAIIYVPPDYEVLANHLGTAILQDTSVFDAPNDPESWSTDNVKQLTLHLLVALNKRIDFVLGQDFLLGHAFLWSVTGDTTAELAASLCRAFDERIAATLRLTFLDQDEALGAILNAGPPSTVPVVSDSGLAQWVSPPTALQGVATARLRIKEMSSIDWSDALRMLRSLLL